MMELILWRHAEAEPGEPDLARALTAKGHKQAWKTADWLDRHLPSRCRIFVSPAVRTVQTAEALGRKFKVHADLAPDMPLEKLLAVAGWPDGKEPVLIVGHQPTLGMAASHLIAGQVQPWSVRKSSAWWIGQKERDDGTRSNYLRAIVTPDLLVK
jgi:phosphohistidine phosphatase